MHYKDEILDSLAGRGNVAQFVAFRPTRGTAKQSFSRIAGYEPNQLFLDIREAIEALLAASVDQSVNVRSYFPQDPRSREFVYGIRSADEALETINRLSGEGLHTIVNETIDVADGGVSGVLLDDTFEFAPDDTPRCVEKPGVAAMSFDKGMALFEVVYGFRPDLDAISGERTEFSIHPRPVGWKRSHTLLWEHEYGVKGDLDPSLRWPNNFSRMIGDKAFGLIIAHLAGVPVPRTLVISRRVAPFSFGRETSGCDTWTRTCPTEQQPGLFTTLQGWTDPFALLQKEDPDGNAIASVISQSAVSARYSGAALATGSEELVIEGISGTGDRFMIGEVAPGDLPRSVQADVQNLNRRLSSSLGPVRFEWVHDGTTAWCVQLHQGRSASTRQILVPGEPRQWMEFRVGDGLAALRSLLAESSDDTGVLLQGEVGLTSHVADVLRKAGRPARLAAAGSAYLKAGLQQ